ncbi:MAG: hypothetical protein GX638_14960 [Crenarchaeota archaeon]|nr:hypothetical protein [Thermoproteota archaeon]
MPVQVVVGYPNNIWNTGYPYSNIGYQNNVTNIYNGNNINIFGNTQQITNNTIYAAPQQQTPDYTGKMIDMMMAMNMMMFQKKLNGTTSDNPKVVIEDAKESSGYTFGQTTGKSKVVIEDTGKNSSKRSNGPTLSEEYFAYEAKKSAEEAAKKEKKRRRRRGIFGAIFGTLVGGAIGACIGATVGAKK